MRLVIIFILLFSVSLVHATRIFVPAVYKTNIGYKGTLAILDVRVSKGHGYVFVDTKPFTEIDTQSSARLAVEVASNIANFDTKSHDFYFIIRSKSPIVGGPSAGAAMTIAVLSEMLNVSIRKDVIITGTINPDGSIGPVGGLLEKAHAIAMNNGTTFLIPKGQRLIKIQETVKTELPGFVEIVSKPKIVDLVEYAKNKWQLEVREVKDVEEAFEYISGYIIEKPEYEEVRNTLIKNAMKSIAETMLKHANSKLNIDVSTLPYQYASDIESLIEEQKNQIARAKALMKNEKYYAASSHLFIASVYLAYANNFVKFMQDKTLLEDYINKVNQEIVEFKISFNSSMHIDNIADIEIYAAVEERLNDANEHIGKSWKYYYANDFISSIYAVSYAEERLTSAKQWLEVSKYFTGNESFDISNLKNVAEKRIEDATSHVLYAKLLGLDIKEADELLSIAEKNYKQKLYSAASFNAVSAKVLATLSMELRGMDEKEKISTYEEDASLAIEKAENEGAVPVLAISFYEYAEALKDKDVTLALRYLKYAKEFASLSLDFKRMLKEKHEEKEVILIPKQKLENTNSYLIIGLIIGLVSGYIVRGLKDVRAIRRRRIVFKKRFT